MLFLKKAWNVLKRYWYVPVIGIAGIILWFVYRPAGSALLKMVEKTMQRHKEEVDELERIHKEETEKKKKAREEYQKAVDAAEKEYNEAQEDLERQKKERVDELVELHKDDPDALTKELSELGGFRVIDAGD